MPKKGSGSPQICCGLGERVADLWQWWEPAWSGVTTWQACAVDLDFLLTGEYQDRETRSCDLAVAGTVERWLRSPGERPASEA